MALTKIDDRGLKTPVDLLDNEKIRFGTGNDLEIYHDGTNNRLDFNTGSYNIFEGGNFIFRNVAGNEDYAKFLADGAVELYYDNVKKFETQANGITITGNCDINGGALYLEDNQKANFGYSNDLQIYHDGSASRIVDAGTGYLKIQSGQVAILNADDSEAMIQAYADGAVELYYDGSKKFETTSTGVTVHGDLFLDNDSTAGRDIHWDVSDNALKVKDNTNINFGDGNDLQIYHNGSNSYINNTTGALAITGNDLNFENAARNETYAEMDNGGAVKLYYDNSKKFETASTGVLMPVTGADASTALQLNGTNGSSETQSLIIDSDGENGRVDFKFNVGNGTPDLNMRFTANATELYYDNVKKLSTASNGIQLEDELGLNDGKAAMFGDGDDLKIYHNGTHSYIWNTNGDLQIRSNSLNMFTTSGEQYFQATQNGAVDLYYDNSKKFETQANGVTVTGGVYSDGLICGDDDKVELGTSGDLQIYHGSDDTSYVYSNNKNLHVCANGSNIEIRPVNAELSARFLPNSAAELYYDNSKKLETHANGIYAYSAGSGGGQVFLSDVSANTRGILNANADSDIGFINTGQTSWTFRVENDGDYHFYGSAGSDRDLKENITTVTVTALDKVTKLVPKTFNWKQTADGLTPTDKTFTGFIAQEVKEHIPSIVTGTDGQKNMGINYQGLLAHTIKAITELKAEVDTLKTKVAALEAA